MLTKNNRTIDKYKSAGAKMRLLKCIRAKLATDLCKVVSVSDYNMLMTAYHLIDEVCSRVDRNMFNDFPELGHDYVNVFYGDVRIQPRTTLDEEMIHLVKQVIDELVK